ncbi:MAG: hypothetical protein DCC58_02155 [Chloroflexi bacterium]|nr:MAG: hypothetical protein DCC58_02155 [Chloroflexota bacterium]
MPKFSGQETIKSDPETIWAFLMDPKRFAACAPAMKNVKVKNEREFSFEVQIMGRGIEFKAKWEDLQRPTYARQKLNGGSMLTGGAKMDNEFRISHAAGVSTVDWTSDVELSGAAKMLVSESQLRGMVNEMIQDAVTCIKGQVETQ